MEAFKVKMIKLMLLVAISFSAELAYSQKNYFVDSTNTMGLIIEIRNDSTLSIKTVNFMESSKKISYKYVTIADSLKVYRPKNELKYVIIGSMDGLFMEFQFAPLNKMNKYCKYFFRTSRKKLKRKKLKKFEVNQIDW